MNAHWLPIVELGVLPPGERPKYLRPERGWSQAELAGKVSADAGQIGRPGRSPHPLEHLLSDRLAIVAKLAYDDLTALRSLIDGLVAKTRLHTLAGGIC